MAKRRQTIPVNLESGLMGLATWGSVRRSQAGGLKMSYISGILTVIIPLAAFITYAALSEKAPRPVPFRKS